MKNNRQAAFIRQAKKAVEGAMMTELFAIGTVCIDCKVPYGTHTAACTLPGILQALQALESKVEAL